AKQPVDRYAGLSIARRRLQTAFGTGKEMGEIDLALGNLPLEIGVLLAHGEAYLGEVFEQGFRVKQSRRWLTRRKRGQRDKECAEQGDPRTFRTPRRHRTPARPRTRASSPAPRWCAPAPCSRRSHRPRTP